MHTKRIIAALLAATGLCAHANTYTDLWNNANEPGWGMNVVQQLETAFVTLFVYGWESVEPGPLSWAFPSLRAALDAVKTMRNAVEWCIVAGSEWVSVDAARAKGAVLIEQNA